MGDAANLGWKLAAVLQGRAKPILLDSYEPERIAFARLLIDGTDRAFKIVTSRSRLVGLLRQHIIPRIVPRILSTSIGSRLFFGLISQTRINYRAGPISSGEVGCVRGGDRLPYFSNGSDDNFAPLDSLDWQVHIYGDPNPVFAAALARANIPLHVFACTSAAERAGLTRDAAYLVRPDGHIAVAGSQDAVRFETYIADLDLRPLSRGEPSRPAAKAARTAREAIFVADRIELMRGKQREFEGIN
jgi:hypothetical protein